MWSWLNRVSSVFVMIGSTQAGQVTTPSARLAFVRWWPAMMSPVSVTMMGLQKPISVMLCFSISSASSAIWRGL